MGSPPGHPLKTRHAVALVFGCVCPYAGYPTHYAAGYPNMVARNIWPLSLSNVKDTKASFSTSTSTCGGDGTTQGTSACTVSGEIIFSQNGLKAGNKYKLFVDTATACLLSSTAGTRKEIVEFT